MAKKEAVKKEAVKKVVKKETNVEEKIIGDFLDGITNCRFLASKYKLTITEITNIVK